MSQETNGNDSGETYLGVALIAYDDALTAAMIALAEFNSVEDLAWIDRIQEAAIRSVRHTISGKIPAEAEDGAIKFSIDVLNGAFRGIRTEITQGMTLASPK